MRLPSRRLPGSLLVRLVVRPLRLPRGCRMNPETVDGYAVPQDPMDLLQCDSCQ